MSESNLEQGIMQDSQEESKDMVWLIGYMRDLIAKEIESEIEEILKNEPNPKKINLKLRSKIDGLQRAADIARERA